MTTSSSSGIPSGWSCIISQTPPQPPSNLVVFKQSNVGLYDGDIDLRHFGEAQLILTETNMFLLFNDVKPDPNAKKGNGDRVGNLEFIGGPSSSSSSSSSSSKRSLFLELQLSSVENYKWIGGFVMFSSPKVQLTLKKSPAQPKLSFRNGGIEDFVKHLETCLKKKSWLKIEDSSATSSSATSPGANKNATSSFSPSTVSPTTTNENNNNTDFTSTKSRAGIAGILARQSEKTDQLRQTIKQSTTGEVDDLIIKSKELQSLMDRFRQEIAKGDYKLCPDQIDHLKKLDARFSIGDEKNASSTSNPHNNSENKNISTTPKEIATDLVRFIQNDSVISTTVRVPLVELFAAFNVSRGFSFEMSPSEFHEALCIVVKNYPEKRILNLVITKTVPSPSFALRSDHLVQFHVLAMQLPVLEQSLGPKPFFSTPSFKKADDEMVSRIVKNYKSINILQCSKLLRVPVDEAKELLLQLELAEGVLMRDDHPSVGMRFSWNLFAIP